MLESAGFVMESVVLIMFWNFRGFVMVCVGFLCSGTRCFFMECELFLVCCNEHGLLWSIYHLLCLGMRCVCYGVCSVSSMLEHAGFVIECVVFLVCWNALSFIWGIYFFLCVWIHSVIEYKCQRRIKLWFQVK